jgi:hypothetical protein
MVREDTPHTRYCMGIPSPDEVKPVHSLQCQTRIVSAHWLYIG